MRLRGLRWWIVALLFGAAVLNDVDRQTLSALAPTIQHDLELDDRAYANVVMNTLVATMVSGPSTKPPGFLDQAIQAVFGPLLDLVQGQGYAQWFIIMALLHPVAWLLLRFGNVHRLSRESSI